MIEREITEHAHDKTGVKNITKFNNQEAHYRSTNKTIMALQNEQAQDKWNIKPQGYKFITETNNLHSKARAGLA